jgi:Cu/Ag efflux protein CusF
MKPTLRILVAATMAGSALLFHSCNTVTGEQTTTVAAERGVPGGTVQQTTVINATVTAIDPATRNVTLVTPAGEKVAVKAGPGVANFPQIRVGDQVRVAYAEQIVLRMARSGEEVGDSRTLAGASSPLGDKPGAALGQSTQATATVTEIDPRRRKVRLQFSDGSSKRFPVRDDIDLSKHRVGEKVVIRYTEALAVRFEKP